jgi:hypothetical protein
VADDDALIADSALVWALEERIRLGAPDVHMMENALETAETAPNAHAHKGVVVALTGTRNMGLSRNRDVARMQGTFQVSLIWRLTAEQRADRTDAMDMGETLKALLTDLEWLPDGVVDQIRYTGATYGYHPAARGWYVVALGFLVDYDTTLGE